MQHRLLMFKVFACLLCLNIFPLQSAGDNAPPSKIKRVADSEEVGDKLWEAIEEDRPWMYGDIPEAAGHISVEELTEFQGKLENLQPIIASVQKRIDPLFPTVWDREESVSRLVEKPMITRKVSLVKALQERLDAIQAYKHENP